MKSLNSRQPTGVGSEKHNQEEEEEEEAARGHKEAAAE